MERHELARLLGAKPNQRAARTVIAESNPEKFIAAFSAAVAGTGDIFLVNPRWGANERGQAAAVIEAAVGHEPAQAGRGWLMIPTGGSSGFVKFARHDSATVAAAVRGFAQHFHLGEVNAVGGLPLYHVSGLVGWLRTVLTGGLYLPAEWEEEEAGLRPELPPRPDGWIISLVPTQLERLLRDAAAVEWLRQFRIVLLGGAPAWPSLLDHAAQERIPIALTYGMTETAAMVTAVRPKEFLAGERSAGTALPHARVGVNADGAITVSGESLFRGYYPHWRAATEPFTTVDGGALDEDGRLRVQGRRDAAIITGGEKVHPGDVEAVLQVATGIPEVRVLGVADAEWGERVVAAFPATSKFSVRAAREAADQELSPAQRPKAYVGLADWPVSEIGKVHRAKLAALVQSQLRAGAGGAKG